MSATRELLAAREEVWAFFAEPYHLADWWPGLTSVEPDRRGFETGARWQVKVFADPPGIGPFRLPSVGRPSGPVVPFTLVITAIEPYERWSWQLIRRSSSGRERVFAIRVVEVELTPLAADRCQVTVAAATGRRDETRLASVAANRLFDRVQTAATL